MFNIENDGEKFYQEYIITKTYIKYPPHSKYVLFSNLKWLLIVLLLISFAIYMIFTEETGWRVYVLSIFMLCMSYPMFNITYKDWKYGKTKSTV